MATANTAPLCEDVLMTIFDHLPYRHVMPATVANLHLRTLASASRVCHVWSEIALNAIYRDLASIQHLLAVLAQFRQEQDRSGSERGIFRGQITPEEWARFQYYARRVHSLDAYDAPSVDESVWTTLSTLCCDETSLLPRLRQVHRLNLCGRTDGAGIHAWLSPEVRMFSQLLHGHIPFVTAQITLQSDHPGTLTLRAPSQNFHNAPLQSPGNLKAPHLIVESFTELRSLSLSPGSRGQGEVIISTSLLTLLSTLPRLTTLHLHDNVCVQRLLETTHSLLVFQELRELTLGWVPARGAAAFFAHTSFPRLRSLVLKSLVMHFKDAEDMPGSLAEISTRIASDSSTVRDIDIRLHDWRSYAPHSDTAPRPIMDILAPLLQCTQLRTLKLHLSFSCEGDIRWTPIALCDSDLNKMTSAWPELVALQIWWTPDVPRVAMDHLPPFPLDAQPPTPQALVAFARTHPHLTDLRLPYICIPLAQVTVVDAEQCYVQDIPASSIAFPKLNLSTWGVFDPTTSKEGRIAYSDGLQHASEREVLSMLDRLFRHHAHTDASQI